MRVKTCKDGSISLDQEQFVNNILMKFNMSVCKGVDAPLESNLKLDKFDNAYKKYPFQQLLKSLMYLSILICLDNSFSISYLNQFNNFFTAVY